MCLVRRFAAGEYPLRVQAADGRVLDEDRIKVPGGYDLVAYNILGAAPLYKENVTYYANTPPADDKAR